MESIQNSDVWLILTLELFSVCRSAVHACSIDESAVDPAIPLHHGSAHAAANSFENESLLSGSCTRIFMSVFLSAIPPTIAN